jgi:hypothetical protein
MRNSTPPNQGNENEIRIIELAAEIERLSNELNRRLQIATEENQRSNSQDGNSTAIQTVHAVAIEEEATIEDFQIGDTVAVTNNYKGNYGRQGKISKITKTQVAIKFPNSPRQVYKKKTNIRFISRDE